MDATDKMDGDEDDEIILNLNCDPSQSTFFSDSNHAQPIIKEDSMDVEKSPDEIRCEAYLKNFEQAQYSLQLSSLPDALPGREEECNEILKTLSTAIQNQTSASLYISGVPGTGKTATVVHVIRVLERNVHKKEVPPFHFVMLNGMTPDPSRIYIQLARKWLGKKANSKDAFQLLTKHFNTPPSTKKQEPIWYASKSVICHLVTASVMLVDELDGLITRSQTVLYNIFEWPLLGKRPLVVIGICNTINLPEQLMARINSRIGILRYTFHSYTKQQLELIIGERLKELKVFNPSAISLCCAKIAAISGDARRALELCRSAASKTQRELQQMTKDKNYPTEQPLVQPQHIQVEVTLLTDAMHELFFSPKLQTFQSCSVHQRLFLCSVAAILHNSQKDETTFAEVIEKHVYLCKKHSIVPIPRTCDLEYICRTLHDLRLLVFEPSRPQLLRKILLNIGEDEVPFTLHDDDVIIQMLNEELGNVKTQVNSILTSEHKDIADSDDE